MPKTPPAKPTGPAKRFMISSTCDGYEVVDRDGRSVTGSFVFANKPLAIAGQLNDAAANGRTVLARALGCIEEDNESEMITEAFEYEI